MKEIKNIDYINVRDGHVHGIINPTFIMYGNCDLEEYDFEVLVDGKKKKHCLNKIIGTENFELFVELKNDDKNIEVYLLTTKGKDLICVRENTRLKRIKSKIRVLYTQALRNFKHKIRKFKYIIRIIGKEVKFCVKNLTLRGCFKRIKYNLSQIENELTFYNFLNQKDYLEWLELYEKEDKNIKTLEYNPLISICIPVYNVERKYLSECLDSILNQTYQNFEICLSNDCSTLKETLDTLDEYERKDSRIKVHHRSENGHISRATNDALAIAKGEFIGLMDNDDLLTKNALYECVKVLNENPELDFIYSDEDKMDMEGNRRDPHFKSDFAPDSILGSNYICHFEIMRKSIVDEIGGFRVGLEGAQDYDIFLRFFEKTTIEKIYHIPKVLYHWRMIEGSTAAEIDNKGYAIEKGRKAVADALKRRGVNAEVKVHPKVPYYIVEYKYEKAPLISIIIPTKDYAEITEQCLKSLYEKTTYPNFEVILMNNNSEKKETFALFDKYKNKYSNFKVIDANYEFNYSKINNQGVKQAKGEYIVLLNNDTEIITPNWLELMVGYAMQPHIGAVGTKLLYPDNTVQHAGVILGVGGIAQHAFVGCSKDDPGFYGRLSVPFNYSAVTAACLMVAKDKFNEVDGLEETLQVAFNDVDFNLKLLEKGYYNVCLNNVELYHHESKSRGLDTTSEKYKRFMLEHEYMREHWSNNLINDKFYNLNFSKRKLYVLDR